MPDEMLEADQKEYMKRDELSFYIASYLHANLVVITKDNVGKSSVSKRFLKPDI